MSHFDDLLEFHRALGENPPEKPTLPSPQSLELRRTLIREEFEEVMQEFEQAQNWQNPLELHALAQELADLLYVTYGSFVALGIDAAAVFAEVHRANMQKTTGPRRADGKILKPEGFVKADVQGILRGLLEGKD
jgi:predicted HAD superfamily Cof-like phosphohydrolase